MSDAVEKPGAASFVPVEVVAAMARGDLCFRDALGVSDESIGRVARYGHKLLETEHYHQARTVFDGLLALDPDVAYFHLGLGLALRNLGDRAAATAEFQRAKALAPENLTADLNLTQMLIEDGDRDAARRLLEPLRQALSGRGHPLSGAFQQIWDTHFQTA